MNKLITAGAAAAAVCALAVWAMASMPSKKPQTVEETLRRRLADALTGAGNAMKRAADRL